MILFGITSTSADDALDTLGKGDALSGRDG